MCTDQISPRMLFSKSRSLRRSERAAWRFWLIITNVDKKIASSDTIIVNSCAVTNEAVRQTRQAIRRAHRERPDKRIFVTGCAVQLDADTFAAMPEVDRVIGNADKYLAASFHRDAPSLVSDVMTAPAPTVAAGFLQRVRSFVAIQTGCDHRCTFCSIWQARGPSRSLPYEAVRSAVERELDAGAREIVLTGVDITSYEPSLGLLCQQLLSDLPALRRLRLSSLDSIEIDDALFELLAGEPRLMPHFHLSLQAGDDMILKRMKRRHSRSAAVRTVERIKAARADATIGADVNIGAGTIICNYDGQAKQQTTIEDGAFIGSDTQLIAPVTIGQGAYIGTGTTVRENVPPGALAVSAGKQRNIDGWVARKRPTKAKG